MEENTSATPAGRLRLHLFVAALTVAAAGAATPVIASVPVGDHAAHLWTAATVLLLLVAAEFLMIRVRYRGGTLSLSLNEAVLAPALFLLPGAVLVPLVTLAVLIEGTIRHIDRTKTIFNAAQWTLAAAAGTTAFAATAKGIDPTPRNLAALWMALTVIALVNAFAVTAVIVLDSRQPVRTVMPTLAPAIGIGWAVNSAFGALLVLSGQRAPEALLLFLAPLVILHRASRGWAVALADRSRLEGMNRALSAFAEEIDPREALPRFLVTTRECFAARTVEMVLSSDDGRRILRMDEGGRNSDRLEAIGASLATALLARGTAEHVTAGHRDRALAALLRQEGWRDCLAAPLVADGRPLGILCAYDRSGPEGFEDGELAVLQALAGEAASMIRKGHLLDEILEERRKLSDIVTLTSDGIMTVDAHGTITTWNPGMEEITHYPAAEMVGSPLLPALRPRDADGNDVMLERWAEIGEVPRDVQIVDKGGEARWLSCTYTHVTEPSGAPRMLILLARDVTKMREIDELKDDFVATVSHELRTPLTPIRGWSTMLLTRGEQLSADERRLAAESIHRQAEHLERLIANLLEASRIERDRGAARDDIVDATAVVQRMTDEVRAAHPERVIRLLVDAEPCLARGNEVWIERITSNLLSNAIKYAPPSEPIEVSVGHDGDGVVVTVSDHGPGIAPRDAEAIFERFRRLGDTTTRAAGGTGLGLYIARQLARSIGATLGVESELGRGATFRLRLRDTDQLAAVG